MFPNGVVDVKARHGMGVRRALGRSRVGDELPAPFERFDMHWQTGVGMIPVAVCQPGIPATTGKS